MQCYDCACCLFLLVFAMQFVLGLCLCFWVCGFWFSILRSLVWVGVLGILIQDTFRSLINVNFDFYFCFDFFLFS